MKESKPLAVKTRREVAEVFAVGQDTVKRWRATGMPGESGAYVIRDILIWLRTEGPWKRGRSSDPLLSTEDDSPALERYRLAKAKLAELDLEHRKGDLIDREKCRELMGRWAVIIRRMGERLGKRYGNEATLSVNDSLAECQKVVDGLKNEE